MLLANKAFYKRLQILEFFWIIQNAAQKMKFFIKDFFSQCDQIGIYLRIWSRLLKKPLMKYFIFCAVKLSYKIS